MMTPTIFFTLVMGIIGTFQVFSVVFVLTDGMDGPCRTISSGAHSINSQVACLCCACPCKDGIAFLCLAPRNPMPVALPTCQGVHI